MEYQIKGTTMPALEIMLDKGQAVYTETSGMSWMSSDVDMATGTRGGIGRIIGRAFAGESLFLTTYRSKASGAKVVFTPNTPGQIIPVELSDGETIIAQRDAFMCAEESVDLSVHLRKRLGSGLFGGEGFIMQRLTGPGMVFAEIGGEVIEYTLQTDEELKVNPGYVAMHDENVDFSISMVRGVRNLLFGGEGVFLATVRGPGRVWLQTMPLRNLAEALSRYMPQPEPQTIEKSDDDE